MVQGLGVVSGTRQLKGRMIGRQPGLQLRRGMPWSTEMTEHYGVWTHLVKSMSVRDRP